MERLSFTKNHKQIKSNREFITKVVSGQALIRLWFTEIGIFLSKFNQIRTKLPLKNEKKFVSNFVLSNMFLERPNIG